MSTKDVYKSEDQLPESIREKFLFFEELPEGYEFAEATFVEDKNIEKLSILYMNLQNEELCIEELKMSQDSQAFNAMNSDTRVENWGEITVYVNEYTDGDQEKVYTFILDNILVDIKASLSMEEEKIKNMIQNVAQI